MDKTFKFRLTEAQYRDSVKHTSQRIIAHSGMRPWITATTFAFFVACMGIGLSVTEASSALKWSLLAAFCTLVALQLISQSALLRGLMRDRDALFGEQRVAVADDGLRIERSGVNAFIGWKAVRTIESVKSQSLIVIDVGSAISVPDTVFASDAERLAFVLDVKQRCGAEGAVVSDTSSGVQQPAAISTPAPVKSEFFVELRSNLVAGARLALFMSAGEPGARANWTQFVALVGLQLAIIAGFDMIEVGLRGEIGYYSLPGVVFGTFLALLAAWGLALLSGRSERTLSILVAISAIAVSLEFVSQLVPLLTERQWLRYGFGLSFSIFEWWFAIAAGIAAIRLLDITGARRIAAVAVAGAFLAIPSLFVHQDRSIWTKAYDKNEQAEFDRRYNALTKEDVFYLQPKLLERELASLKPGRKGVIDLYFIGGAGWAGQDVFMKEVRSVSALFEERFDAKGRVVRLVNNPKTVAELPIASATSLRLAVKKVAEVMDRDEDILFLFLTSHGSKDHSFSLQFYPLKFNELTPDALRKILDEAGIKRRVLVVSACYSGGFVDALKDENSLVITAAAPDKNSFGCSNEADFTYFGKAYFDEALRETYSFAQAFEIAKPRIAEREKKSDYNPSDPRIFLGAAIRQPLADLEDRLKVGATPPIAVAPSPSREKDSLAKLIDLWLVPEILVHYRAECIRSMAQVSPATYVAKDPNYYGGLTPASPHWTRLMIAWNEYAEEYCAASNDKLIFRTMYEDAWRRALDAHDADSVLSFFATRQGKKFLQAEVTAAKAVSSGISEVSAPARDKATAKLQQTQISVNADFQRDQAKASRK